MANPPADTPVFGRGIAAFGVRSLSTSAAGAAVASVAAATGATAVFTLPR